MKNADKILAYIVKIDPKKITSISDLQIKEFDGDQLEPKEKVAIEKFREARIKKLQSNQSEEASYHAYFEYYRALGNLVDYRDILKEKLPL